MTKTISRFSPAIGWLFITTFLLTLPGSAIPEENWLDKIWADKWIHIALFALLVILWCRGVTKKAIEKKLLTKHFIAITILAIGYGIGMEFVQRYLIPNRSFDIIDILADAAGCMIGLGFCLRRYIKK
ncbi:MAG: VanZ family protein [Chitinophagaceae bacterium]|nr:VanZ family protein [Chitinophagaceae bacterium]